MNREEIEGLIEWNEMQFSYTLHGSDASKHRATAAALRAQQERIDALEAEVASLRDDAYPDGPEEWSAYVGGVLRQFPTKAEAEAALKGATLTGEKP